MRGTLLELRPGALAHNARRARALAGKARVFAMVKADGYGHGLGLAARALAHQVDGLGVAVMEEAQALRHLGLAHPLLVAEGFFDAEELALAARLHAEVAVHSPWQVDLLVAQPRPVGVWLKVNTGMNRLGMAADLARAQAALKLQRYLHSLATAWSGHHVLVATYDEASANLEPAYS